MAVTSNSKTRKLKKARDRLDRFRTRQAERGYINRTIPLSHAFRQELERLSADEEMNRQEAMDHVFEVYQTFRTRYLEDKEFQESSAKLQAENERLDKLIKTVDLDELDGFIWWKDIPPHARARFEHGDRTGLRRDFIEEFLEFEPLESEGDLEKISTTTSQIPFESDLGIFTGDDAFKLTLPDCTGEKMSLQDRDKYLFRVEEMFPGPGKNHRRAEELNKAGIITARGNRWTAKTVREYLNRATKRNS